MNFILRFAAKTLLFLAMLFCFLVLFQYGPGDFVAKAESEWSWVRSFLPSSGENDMINIPDAPSAENSGTVQ